MWPRVCRKQDQQEREKEVESRESEESSGRKDDEMKSAVEQG